MAVLVLDSAPLSSFARAGRLDTLRALTEGDERVTTRAVMDEIEEGVRAHPELQGILALDWLRVERVDGLAELRAFARYASRLGSDVHNVGEASVLAWAEVHGVVALTDDEPAVQAGREHGVSVQRTLALVARGVRRGIISQEEGGILVDQLLRAGARFPFDLGEFIPWAAAQGLLQRAE